MEKETFERLIATLSERFSGASLDFGPKNLSDSISGVIEWSGYESMSIPERQRTTWDAIRAAIGPESTQVSTLVTLTPGELADFNEAV